MNETKKLAHFLAELKYEDLPSHVVDCTKQYISDDIGCMIGGALQLGNKSLLRDIKSLGEKPESTAIYYGVKTSAANAALVNGAFIAGWDYDSLCDGGGGHMGSQTAALLAVGERQLSCGKDLITAECAGIEAQCRVGYSAQTRSHGIGGGGAYPWHSNTSLGPFAAAVTAAKLLNLSPELMEHTIAITCANLGGNYQHYFGWGSTMKRARCGVGAWAGVRAALLALSGITGPPHALEGEKGYFEAMAGRDEKGEPWFEPSLLTEGLGEKWNLLSYSTKAGGCGCVTTLQCPALTAAALKRKYNPAINDIKSVSVEFRDEYGLQQAEAIKGNCLGDTPEQRLGSSGWSLQWIVAEALVVGIPGIREQLGNIKPFGKYRQIEQLSEKITGCVNRAYYDEHFGSKPHHLWGGRVIVTMKDGTIYEHEPLTHPGCRLAVKDGEKFFHGGSINKITDEQLEEKFRAQAEEAGFSATTITSLVNLVKHFEELENLKELISRTIYETGSIA